ncbi:MAG TPA: hypothetical protein VFK22_09325 [Candidatus Dormibacteraeota bacterium]|nr:hypothetical protein [Candidatus Dormibacteraeota bacterium]
MTLRTELRETLDDVVPSAPPQGLSERVLRTAIGVDHRRRTARWTYRLRAPLSLVAVFVLIAIVGAVLVGGRVMRGNEQHNAPAATRTLAQLEAVPLTLPVVQPGDVCPDNPGVNSLGYDYGSGPVYVNGKLIPEIKFVDQSGAGGLYELTYYAMPALKGKILVRGRDLVTGRPIQFIAPNASGIPSDTPPWPSSPELVLDAAHPPSRSGSTGYGIWHVRQLIDQGWSGCWGLEIDGSDFSEKITGYIRPY